MKRALLLGLVLTASPVLAQSRTVGSQPVPPEQLRLRYQLQVMERVLEQAVQHGAEIMGTRLRSLTPDLLLFAGPARARGFKLEGYGLFFDVEVPALRQSIAWSFRVLNQPDLDLSRALDMLRHHVQSVRDDSARASLEQALARLEIRVGPAWSAARDTTRAAAIVGDEPAPARPPSPPAQEDPVAQYTGEVRNALLDAMLDHSGGLTLASDDWLIVAARDSDGFASGDLDQPVTLTLRIRGQDLAGYRAGQLARDEAKKRVEAREF